MQAVPTFSPSAGNVEEEHRKKRLRKGTKSCWECKRRKIKCQLSTESVAVCSGCLARGVKCLSQDRPEEQDAPASLNIGERLGRVEALLEKLFAKMTAYEDEEEAQKINTPESMGTGDVLTQYPNTSSHADSPLGGALPSLFGNSVTVCRETTPSTEALYGGSNAHCKPIPKIDRVRQVLVKLLPSQHDMNVLCSSSSSWLLMHRLSQRGDSDFMLQILSNNIPTLTWNVGAVSQAHPAMIARMLLYVTVALQQLPPDFDWNKLQQGQPSDARLDRYISIVQSLVTSDDELASTIEGLECLSFQGLYQFNVGNLRRAWLTYRRAMNIGQLMGLYKREEAGALSSHPSAKLIWLQIVQADRYLGLLLGMPCGSADEVIGPEETFTNPKIHKGLLFTKKLMNIAGRIIERNQAIYTSAFAITQDIDERFETLAKKMPKSWWTIPVPLREEFTEEGANAFDNIMTQIWFFQLEQFLHLPFMIRAATEPQFNFSKVSCLKASREVIYRYLALRGTGTTSFCCKILDFGTFIATVTLLVGFLQSLREDEGSDVKQQKESDKALVGEVLATMETVARKDIRAISAQSVNIIKTLLEAGSNNSVGNMRLKIPYFGTICIVRPPVAQLGPNIGLPSPIQQQLGSQPQAHHWPPYSQNPVTAPIVSFQCTQFPQLEPEEPYEDWWLQESDKAFFDGMLTTDSDANWMF